MKIAIFKSASLESNPNPNINFTYEEEELNLNLKVIVFGIEDVENKIANCKVFVKDSKGIEYLINTSDSLNKESISEHVVKRLVEEGKPLVTGKYPIPLILTTDEIPLYLDVGVEVISTGYSTPANFGEL